MPQVELDYFSLPYNKKNEKTIVTNSTNLNTEGLIIKVGETDSTCRVNIEADLLTVINKVKPDLVVLKNSNYNIENFCEKIGIRVLLERGLLTTLEEDPNTEGHPETKSDDSSETSSELTDKDGE